MSVTTSSVMVVTYAALAKDWGDLVGASQQRILMMMMEELTSRVQSISDVSFQVLVYALVILRERILS